jgi:hypothetical protein
MKVYAVPEQVHFAEPDYTNYDSRREEQRETEHKQRLKDWLVAEGYNGEHTGEVVRFSVADGYAQYMLADKGRNSFLVHLPYGDAYQYRDVQYLPREEILKRLEQERNLQSLFGPR